MTPLSLDHVVIYREDSTFCAWPFSGGLWQFPDGELVAGFIRNTVDYSDPETVQHRKVNCEGGQFVLIRSYDGGQSWPQDTITEVYRRPEFDARTDASTISQTADHSFDPGADGFMLISGYGFATKERPQGVFVIISTDRGRTWTDPVRVPTWMRGGRFTFAESRPSTILRDDGVLLLAGSASREDDQSGYGNGAHPVIWASWNGGASWGFLSEVELDPPEPCGILPYPLKLQNGEFLLAVRRQYDGYNAYTQVYASTDQGRTWSFRSRVNDWGAPANLAQLPDGRLVCVYGYRQKPWGIRARVSTDNGQTWGREIILRDDGGSWDLGYPRTLVKPDGTLITVYYFNRQDDPIQQEGGVRHIAATIWRI